MKKSIRKIFAVLVLACMLVTMKTGVKAQCAMCSATVDSDHQNGNSAVKGLNNGILFLLAAPYVAVAIGGYIWYKKYRRKNVNIDIPGEKLHLN